MLSLVYVSRATHPFSRDELLDMLGRAREANARLGITGMLLYKHGEFMQVLEGDDDAVLGLYERIQGDRRHCDIHTVDVAPLDRRHFEGWSMAFRDLGEIEPHVLPGFSDFLDRPFTSAELRADPSTSRTLLMLFRKNA